MKRTALKRTVPLCRKARMKRINRSRLAKRRAVQFGPQAAWCRTVLCAACGQEQAEPHHVKSRGAGGTDRDCVNLGRHCHSMLHAMGRSRWEQATGVDLSALLLELRRRFYPDRP